MITVVAVLNIRDGQTAAFEAAFQQAAKFIASAPRKTPNDQPMSANSPSAWARRVSGGGRSGPRIAPATSPVPTLAPSGDNGAVENGGAVTKRRLPDRWRIHAAL